MTDKAIIVSRTETVVIRDPAAQSVVVSGKGGGAGQPLSSNVLFSQSNVVLGRSTAGAGVGEEIPCNAFGRSVMAATVVAGSLLFAASASAIGTDNSNLFWDDTNNRLGIGTAAPPYRLTVDDDAVSIRMRNKTATRYRTDFSQTVSGFAVTVYDDIGAAYMPHAISASTYTFYPSASSNNRVEINASGSIVLPATSAGAILNNSAVTSYFLGNVLIGTTTDDGANKLQVAGGVSINGAYLVGAANVLEQRNGTNAQSFRVYSTYTDAANYAYLVVRADAGNAYVTTQSAGTGPAITLNVGSESDTGVALRINGAQRWVFAPSGNAYSLRPVADNENDIGLTANRPRTAYIATSIVLEGPTGFVNGLTLSSAAAGGIPTIAATGADTNIDLTLTPKGSGVVNVNGVLKIGNTANAVSPTAPDRTITIDVGGTTLYLHAKTTND